ncbi:MAG TPA: MBL fold metallo-hydrolase [Candidatus Polarisedimenticolia bacterium]|nr:MBL fold metallo-hydrolase [Candidatus Polarisedimenticolia bacterium]
MILDRVEHPAWRSNTWLVAAAAGKSGFLVDAGGPVEPVLELIARHRVRVEAILLTHHHHDHAGEAGSLAGSLDAEIYAHRDEIPLLGAEGRAGARPTHPLDDGATLTAGGLAIRLLHIPGHTAGQAAWLVEDEVVFTGDTLFRGSVGSTVAPGHTTFADLRRSLVDRLLALPDRVQVAPGHAEPSTIGAERTGNPFLRVMTGAERESDERCRYSLRPARLVVWAPDYDGGHKAWVRFDNGDEATVPGSRVERSR